MSKQAFILNKEQTRSVWV